MKEIGKHTLWTSTERSEYIYEEKERFRVRS